ncbi:hypothetical protein I6L80_15340 [Providencia rettgeri]|uniref:Uncharacterized protein n=1 Tax=Providencia rettgeri TaxID=587 RepID=A0A379FTR7_PRORE|nr:hypothetical protein [Providencia rettgeri]QXB04744.1 hypothetical protein I6L80_15340 [Providencia rettgeri]SUC32037.1 Uncharacterised protein [Providencia rettgeri]
MKANEIIKIKDFSNYSTEQLLAIAINGEASSEALIEGVGAIGTLLFESSCTDNDGTTKDTLGKIGLLIQESIIIAQALDDNVFYSNEEIKRRSAPPPIKIVSYQKISYMVLLGILIMLSFLCINLKVTYTKMNQTPQRYMHN